ncbi:hypothetical protein MOE50_21025 [Bacillus inaquosorum]|uniref:hypothetical protein n=1 Tax=Bacillus inaquosorum TaxID=483913 RepID=UPI00227FAA19|nr:hypothetical protein [Bacillus inaquosorum]MCY9011432.1 hypothetical protein [Bacillus inaquosorum]MCY9039676.1 hypothetical protein [Bacillus inaquosorum]MCY9045130.1 hypothetical protein [Bacillus inaquosorum]
MKNICILILLVCFFILPACSNSETVSNDSPDYIKESFEYYKSMHNVINAVSDGENIDVAYKKYFSNEEEANDWVTEHEEDLDSSDEEQLVVSYIKILSLKISTMNIEHFNQTLGGDVADYSDDLDEIQEPIYDLEQIYEKYGFKSKDNE